MTEYELSDYGLDDFFLAQIEARADETLVPARVISQHRERLGVALDGEVGFARLKSAAFFHGKGGRVFPVVGDFVLMTPNASGDGVIHDVLERKSVLRRSSQDRPTGEDLVANFDKIFIVVPGNQELNRRRLERYVAAAWASGAQPGLIITKLDLTDDLNDLQGGILEVAAGVPLHFLSSTSGDGIDDFQASLAPGETVVFFGPSGVGKSSLVNRLAGTELMATGGVRDQDQRGRHTTTHRELFRLGTGTLVIDTPGLRALGVLEAAPVESAFDEIGRLAEGCRFDDCTHHVEPGCTVIEARQSGALSEDRWDAYVKLLREARYEESRQDIAVRLQEKQTWKDIRKFQKATRRKY